MANEIETSSKNIKPTINLNHNAYMFIAVVWKVHGDKFYNVSLITFHMQLLDDFLLIGNLYIDTFL